MANTTPVHCAMFNGQTQYCDAIIAVKKSMSALSLLGCLFMIGVIWLFKKYVAFPQRLILYLTIAALCASISYLMSDLHEDGPLCDFKAWALTFFDWCVVLWVCCVTFNLFMNAVKMKSTDRFEWLYHIFSWGIPLIISFLPFINNHYGPAGLWCWIKGDWRWRFGIWYAPLFIIIFALFSVYIYIIFTVNRKAKTWEGLYDPDVERNKELMKEHVKPLRGYPFVFLAVSIFPLINRIQNAINPDHPVFALMLLHALSAPLQGALNAVVFGLDKETRSRITWTQIKVAFSTRNQSQTIREYPVAFRSQAAYPNTNPLQFPKFDNVNYAKLT